MTSVKSGMRAVLIGQASWGPIWLAQGGATSIDFVVDDKDSDDDPFAKGDDDDDDDDDDDEEDEPEERPRARKTRRRGEEEDEDGDEGEEEDETWIPPTRKDWERLREGLKRNNSENHKLRFMAKTAKRLQIDDFDAWLADRGIDPNTGDRVEGDGSVAETTSDTTAEGDKQEPRKATPPAQTQAQTQLAIRRAADRAAAETEARYKPALVATAARAAFVDAGWASADLGLAIRLLGDMDDIQIEWDELTGDPVFTGLDEEIERVKKGFPSLFRRRRGTTADTEERQPVRRRRRDSRDIDAGDRGRQSQRPVGWLETLNQQLG